MVFDFRKLDTISHVLDLIILASDQVDQAIDTSHGKVTRAIDQFGITGVERVLYERAARLFWVIPIPAAERTAAHAKFTLLAGRTTLINFIEDNDIGVTARLADRQWLVICNLTLYDIKSTIDMDFDGTVQIDKRDVCEGLAPLIEMSSWKHLASKENRSQIWERNFL
ncbi:hypothetical protein ASF59_05050 [Methylobacterium sp. Leaf121]|nr:hypothetical protein ASF59_05050 [Methylobacterium sp. Leaf121]